MPENVDSCPLCGISTFRLFDRREFRGQVVTNQICNHCGLVFQSPRMTEVEANAFYEAEYRVLYQGQESPNPKDLTVQKARAESALAFISQHVKQISSHLDIGCSTGNLLLHFRAHYSSQATGIEPGMLYRQYAQKQDLIVYPSLEDLQTRHGHPFDLVSLMHVLEHLPDPVKYLQNLRLNLLKTNGWLLLEVPNLYAHDCFEVAHMVSFSPHTLVQVVRKAGFRPMRIRRHGQPRSELLPLYITMLAQPVPDGTYSNKPEHLVRLKRQLGFARRRLLTRLYPGRAWLPIQENNP